MALAIFIGAGLLAFSPILAIFFIFIRKNSIRIILCLTGSFFWLVALLLGSVVWFIFSPLRDVLTFGLLVTVLFQEGIRALLFIILKKAEKGLKVLDEEDFNVSNSHKISLTIGVGFGAMSGIISFADLLSLSAGPGTFGLKGDPAHFLIISGFLTLSGTLLHSFWNVIFFNGMQTGEKAHIIFVVSTHILVSSSTLLNGLDSPLYMVSLPISYLTLLVTGALAAHVSGLSLNNLKAAVTNAHDSYAI